MRTPTHLPTFPPKPNLRVWTWLDFRQLITSCHHIEDEGTRQAALDAVDRLERCLGADWVGGGLASNHPLDGIFQNHAMWTRVYLVEVADAIESAAKDPAWPRSIRGRLRNSREAANALLECQLALQARRSGLTVEFRPAGRAGRYADLAVSDRDARLVVEITTAADFSRRAGDELAFRDRLCPRRELHQAQLAYGCRLEGSFPSEQHVEVEGRLQQFWAERIETGAAADLDIPGTLSAWVAPIADQAARDHYVRAGVPEGVTGPEITDSTWYRVARAARSKLAQLPAGGQCLVIVRPPTRMGYLFSPASMVAPLSAILDGLPDLQALGLTLQTRNIEPEGLLSPAPSIAGIYSEPEGGLFLRVSVVVAHPLRLSTASAALIDRWFGSVRHNLCRSSCSSQ